MSNKFKLSNISRRIVFARQGRSYNYCPDGDWVDYDEDDYEPWLEGRCEFNQDELPF